MNEPTCKHGIPSTNGRCPACEFEQNGTPKKHNPRNPKNRNARHKR